MQETRPVLVAGAGPTGMTAAMELARFGVPVRIIDKYKEPSNTSRALAVQSRTLEFFAQRGLSEEMVRLGNKGEATTLYADGKALGRVDFGAIPSRFNYILLLAQSETERILREHLHRRGVSIECETELIAFAQPESSGVRAIVRKPNGSLEEIDAAYLIAAEGAHSVVRHTLNLPFKGKSLEHSYALADLYVDGALPESELSIFLGKTGLLAVFAMGSKRFRVIATEQQEAGRDAPDPDLPYMQQLYDRGAHIPARFRDLVWSSRFRINSRMLDRLQEKNVFFGGDSAHIHSPAGGQGMNTGIGDMVNLAWKLALLYRGEAKRDLLETYQAERLPVIQRIVSTTETATDAFNTDHPALLSLIRHALPIALHFEAARTKGAGLVSELEANYRKSKLSLGRAHGGSLQPGDRIEDLRVMTETRGPAFLLDLLEPSRFTLLVSGKDDGDLLNAVSPWSRRVTVRKIAPAGESSDEVRFKEALGDAVYVLVRPDGYIACIGADQDAAESRQWFEAWFEEQSRSG